MEEADIWEPETRSKPFAFAAAFVLGTLFGAILTAGIFMWSFDKLREIAEPVSVEKMEINDE